MYTHIFLTSLPHAVLKLSLGQHWLAANHLLDHVLMADELRRHNKKKALEMYHSYSSGQSIQMSEMCCILNLDTLLYFTVKQEFRDYLEDNGIMGLSGSERMLHALSPDLKAVKGWVSDGKKVSTILLTYTTILVVFPWTPQSLNVLTDLEST